MPRRRPSSPTAPATVAVLGVRFHALDREEAAAAIARLATADGRAYVVKPYSEFMPRAVREPRVRDILNQAGLCLADGAGIIWAAHYLRLPGGKLRALFQLPLSLGALLLRPGAVHGPLRQAMAGVDLTWLMLGRLREAGATVFLLGGTQEEIDRAAEAVKRRLPGLRIAGARHGYFSTRGAESDSVIAEINEKQPQALLVGMGFPRQEKWISANLAHLNVRVAIAEGGSFSFLSGAVPRAPIWMRRSGLEWLYRLLRQPSRWRRQLALPVFVWLVVRERMAGSPG